MAEKNKHIDDIVRKELSNYTEAPREAMWSKIEQNLDKLDAGSSSAARKGSERKGFWAVIGGVLLLSSGLYFATTITNKHEDEHKIIAKAKSTEISNNNNTVPSLVTQQEDKRVSSSHNPTTLTNPTTIHNNTIAAVNNSNENPVKKEDIQLLSQTNAKPINYQTHTVVQVPGMKQEPVIKINTDVNKITQPTTPTAITITKNNVSPLNTVTPLEPAPVPTSQDNDRKTEEVNAVNTSTPKAINNKNNDKVLPQKQVQEGDPVLVSDNTLASANQVLLPEQKVTNTQPQQQIKTGEPVIIKENTTGPVNNTTTEAKIVSEGKVIPVATTNQKTFAANNNVITNAQQELTVPNAIVSTQQLNAAAVIINDSKEQKASDVGIAGANNVNASLTEKETPRNHLRLPFDMGLKLSYETGKGTYTGNKSVISGYAEMPLTQKLSLLFEPGLMITVLNREIDYGTNPYYDNAVTKYDSSIKVSTPQVMSKYIIYQQYDSMSIARKSGRPVIVGFDFPILGKYQLTNNFSVLAGVNINISKVVTISETNKGIYTAYSYDHDSTDIYTHDQVMPLVRNFNPNHSFGQYETLQQPTNNPLRLGYMIGIGYKVNQKMNFELMLSQTLTNQRYIPDANVRNIYTQPYFRLSIGYNLYKHTMK